MQRSKRPWRLPEPGLLGEGGKGNAMRKLLTKTKFVNALVREHIDIEKTRKEFGQELYREYLRLELIGTTSTQPFNTIRLVIRGNRMGTFWMILEQEFQNTPDGLRSIYKTAVEIAFIAAQKASDKLKQPVQIGIPPVAYFDAWFRDDN